MTNEPNETKQGSPAGQPAPNAASSGHLTPPKRNWWKTLFLGCVILASGMVIGSVATLAVIRQEVVDAIHAPGYMPMRMVDNLSRQLDLSQEQSRQLHDILRSKHDSMRHLRQRMVPPFMLEIESFQDEVSTILTPEQAQEWEQICDRMRRTWIDPLKQALSESSDAEIGDASEPMGRGYGFGFGGGKRRGWGWGGGPGRE